jgi:hypothetical protein
LSRSLMPMAFIVSTVMDRLERCDGNERVCMWGCVGRWAGVRCVCVCVFWGGVGGGGGGLSA